jgi:hypothetical protein
MNVLDVFRKKRAREDDGVERLRTEEGALSGYCASADEEAVAAISAAIFFMYRGRECDIVIRSIDRREEPVSVWTYEGRRDMARRK